MPREAKKSNRDHGEVCHPSSGLTAGGVGMGVPWGAGWHYGDAIVLIVGRCAIVVAPSPRTPTRYRIDLRGGACALSAGEAGIEMNE